MRVCVCVCCIGANLFWLLIFELSFDRKVARVGASKMAQYCARARVVLLSMNMLSLRECERGSEYLVLRWNRTEAEHGEVQLATSAAEAIHITASRTEKHGRMDAS